MEIELIQTPPCWFNLKTPKQLENMALPLLPRDKIETTCKINIPGYSAACDFCYELTYEDTGANEFVNWSLTAIRFFYQDK